MYCSTHICTWHDLSIIQIWIFEMYREFNNARKYLLPVWKSHIQSERTVPPIHPYRRPSFMSKHAQRTQIHVYTRYTQRNSLSLSNTSSRNKLQRPEKLILTCYHERTTRVSLSLSVSRPRRTGSHIPRLSFVSSFLFISNFCYYYFLGHFDVVLLHVFCLIFLSVFFLLFFLLCFSIKYGCENIYRIEIFTFTFERLLFVGEAWPV